MKSYKFEDLRSFSHHFTQLKIQERGISRLDTKSCNEGELNEKDEATLDRKLKIAQKIADVYGLRAYHQSDPRGCSLYLITKDMNDTNYSNGIACC